MTTKTEETEIDILPAEEYVINAYKKYGKYTLEERAIPCLQDGLLPVQRRILYAMYVLGLSKGKVRFVKCAKVVGDTMGSYHPHGDAGIYGALVNMANPEMKFFGGDPRAPILPQGNFGIPKPGEGTRPLDPPAAMRYTECSLSTTGRSLFECIDVANMVPTFDGTKEEPYIVPVRLPVLLMNGAYGVATGANTSIPAHYPIDVLRAARHLLKYPNSTLRKLVSKVKGPDVGHSSIISTKEEIMEMYRTGSGSIKFLCDHHIERGEECHELIVTSLAPGFGLRSFLKLCDQLESEGKILAINDNTGSEGTRIVIQFKDPVVVEERILPRLQTSVHYNWNVIDKENIQGDDSGVIHINLTEYLSAWLDFRRDTERKMLLADKEKNQKDLAREGAKLAGIQNIEVLAKILANTKLSEEESNNLIKEKVKLQWGSKVKPLSDGQVQMLLDQKIRSLRALNLDTQVDKVKTILRNLKQIKKNLENLDQYLYKIIKETEKVFSSKYKRGTRLLNGEVPALEMPEGDAVGFWVVNKHGYIRDVEKLPQKKGKWYKDSWTIPAVSSVYFVESSGTVSSFGSVYLTRGKSGLKNPVVGVCSDRCEMLLVMDEKGYIGIIDLPTKKQKMVVMKTDHPIVFAAGVNPDDVVYVTNGKAWSTKIVKDIGSKRPNSKGSRILRTEAPVDIRVIPKGGVLVKNGEGSVDFEQSRKTEGVFALAPKNNWVVDVNNVKKVMDKSEASGVAKDPGILEVSLLR